jgi:protein-S-isoprenylcysteine O-methyltransferase Ste14
MRHALRAVALPLVVIGLLPWVVLRASHGEARPTSLELEVVGAALIAVGLALITWTISLFARVGKGTLAPWEPPRHLVVVEPYAHVRNPMISGGLCILTGGAIFFASIPLAVCTAVFFVVNEIYFILSEEPGLFVRFGEKYLTYKANVPRWLPRWHKWQPPLSGSWTTEAGDRR